MANDWVLALEQNQDLSVAHGSAADVAAALRRGAELRVYMITETFEETIYFQQTYVGEGEEFCGLMSHHHSYDHRGAPADQPYFSLFKYGTSGRYDHIKWMFGNKIYDESKAYPYEVYRWFVDDRYRVVYEHDAAGERLSGDLQELKELVRTGRTIRVGIRQLDGLVSDDSDGPAHLSFLTTMQPIVRDGHVLSNCDLVLIGPPKWPYTFAGDGVHLAMMRPSTSGEFVSYVVRPGELPFERQLPRRAMQWLVAERS